jgi:hypothetical protein
MFQRMCRRTGRAGLASVTATALALAGMRAPASAAVLTLTLSSNTGPSGGGAMISGTVPGSTGPFVPEIIPTIQFQYAESPGSSCSSTPQVSTQITAEGMTTTAGVVTVDPETIRRITFTRIAFEVPSTAYPAVDDYGNNSTVNTTGLVLLGEQISARWHVCVYGSDSVVAGELLASGEYTLVRKPVITSIIPASGASAGGQLITVLGAGFNPVSAPITATIGDMPLTDIKAAASGNSFTAITGPRAAADDLALVVNAPGGTVSSLDPDNNGEPEDGDNTTNDSPIPFRYSNGLNITPNTSALDTVVNIDVRGAGFTELEFSDVGNPGDSLAHVFLVDGAYESATNRGVAECTGVMVVSDTELICTLDLTAFQLNPTDSSVMVNSPITEGAYFVTVVESGDVNAGPGANPTIMSSGSAFVVAPY